MKLSRWISFGLLALTGALCVQSSPTPQHERLRFRNTFQTPEEVVRYYCGRDASGFVWSGLLEVERRAFTLWKDLPQSEQFLIAEQYQVEPAQLKSPNEASVEVRYRITGMGDAHGTVSPPTQPDLRVEFKLRKDQGAWKIAYPEASAIAPVVLASKFRYATASP